MILNKTENNELIRNAIRIFNVRLKERHCALPKNRIIELDISKSLPGEGYSIASLPGTDGVRVSGGSPKAILYGLGKLLRNGIYGRDGKFSFGPWRGATAPAKPYRIAYLASHFFNVYHVADRRKVDRYIEDLALCGYNYLSLSLAQNSYKVGEPAFKKYKARLINLYKCGMRVGMRGVAGSSTVAPQGTPMHLRAKRTGRSFYGLELCPSKPEGMKLLCQFLRETCEWLKDIDIGLFTIWSYDQGGCGCEKCAPYGCNGMYKMGREYAKIAKQHFKDCKIIYTTWLFDYPYDKIVEWPGLYKAIKKDKNPYIDIIMADSHEEFPKYPLIHGLPDGIELITFPEISMWGRYPWGGFGATPLRARFTKLYGQVCHIASGGRVYSEGIFEDFNKILYAAFFWNGTNATDEIIAEYARYEFGLTDPSDFIKGIEMLERNHATLMWRRAELCKGPGFVKIKTKPGIRRYGKWKFKNTRETLDIFEKIDSGLPCWGRKSWRWRLFMIRAMLDYRLSINKQEPDAVCERALKELAAIYETEARSRGNVAVYTDFWVKNYITPADMKQRMLNKNDPIDKKAIGKE